MVSVKEFLRAESPPTGETKKVTRDKAEQKKPRSSSKTARAAMTEFPKYFTNLSGKYMASEIFLDFLDYVLLAFKWWERDRDFSFFEKKYGDTFPLFADMFASFSEASDNGGEGFRDALGDLFMNLVSHGHNGQFFTPDNICDIMIKINASALKDGESVYDCACGSGRMFLAAAKLNRNAFFYGCDIDTTCCKMAVINLLVNSLQGEIALMDSLAMEYTKSWSVSIRNVHGVNLPFYTEIEDKDQSMLWQMHINSFKLSAPILPIEAKVEEVKIIEEILTPVAFKRKDMRKKQETGMQLSFWDSKEKRS